MSTTIFSFISVIHMGEQRVNAGIKVPPDLKRALQRQAVKEDKTLSKLGEVLLQWAFKQLQVAGDSLELKQWEAQPVNKDQLAQSLDTDRKVFEGHESKSKPKSTTKKVG